MLDGNTGRVIAAVGLLASQLTVSTLGAQEGRLVFLAGVAEPAGEDIETQTAATLDRLGQLLGDRGLDFRDVVAANVVLRDARHFRAMNDVYRRFFRTDPPTRATVQADLPDPDALIQISVVAAEGPRQVVAPTAMRSPELPYSWGTKVGNTLFIAGATSRSPDTYQPVTGDVAAQTRRVFGNIGLVLDAAGMEYGDLVSCRVFLADGRRFRSMNEAYREFVPAADPPARATVRAGLMNPAFGVEIQCVAESSGARTVVIGEGRRRSRSPFSPAISTGERLYLSGMVGSGPDGVPPDVASQTRYTLENLRATLAAAEMDFSHVVDMWVYVTDIRQWGTVEEVLGEMLPDGIPAMTVIGAPLMGSTLLVEIQMVAER